MNGSLPALVRELFSPKKRNRLFICCPMFPLSLDRALFPSLWLRSIFRKDLTINWPRQCREKGFTWWRSKPISCTVELVWNFPKFFGFEKNDNYKFDSTFVTLCSSNITFDSTFVTFGGSLIFFLTFDNSILTLCSSNITFDCTFVTFGGSFNFSHIWRFYSHIV